MPPKVEISEAGEAAYAISDTPIAASAIPSANVSLKARSLVTDPNKPPSENGPRNLHSDVYIKYDPRTKNGYALRYWRTTQSSSKCMFQLYQIVDGIGRPIDDHQVLSGVFKANTTMMLRITRDKFVVDAVNSENDDSLHLEGTITPNRFGGGGVFWPGGSANTYSRMDISYPED